MMPDRSIQITAHQLREIVCKILSETIEIRRASQALAARTDERPAEDPTDEEVDDFLFCNPLLDSDTVAQLTDEGLLGFDAKTATTTTQWLTEFRENVSSWATNKSWLGGGLPLFYND